MIDYDRLAAEYARHRSVHPDVATTLIRRGGVVSGSRVLDVGCGTGNYIIAVAEMTGCSGWAIDPSEQMLARARVRSERVVFQLGRAEHLDFADSFFDLVFSVDVIHHLRDRPGYFHEARRVLRGGGKICTVTDSERIIQMRQPLSTYFPETVEIELSRYPRIADLRREMIRAGFSALAEDTVEFQYQLTDAQPYRDRAFSALHLIPQEAFARGLARMERDLRTGPIACVSRYLLLWGV